MSKQKNRTPHPDTGPLAGFSVGSRTDVGSIREHNEDSLLVKPPLYVIADGMGGHAAGEVASELAVGIFEQAAIENLDADALRNTISKANSAIIKGAQQGLGRSGMGTTLTAAVVADDQLLIAQVGDSRAYLLSGRHLHQVTRDHSLVEELMSSGQITADEARNHPNRSVITKALGSSDQMLPDIYEMRLHSGDRLLLCSDGLNNMLSDDEICDVLLSCPDSQMTADSLVHAAKEAGGFDNITVIVVNIDQVNVRQERRQQRRFVRGVLAFLIAFVVLVGATVGGIYSHAQGSYYFIEENGYLMLYRGLPGELMGIRLSWLEEATSIRVQQPQFSPTFISELQKGVPVGSREEAAEFIDNNQLPGGVISSSLGIRDTQGDG